MSFLHTPERFVHRHIGPSPQETEQMLETIGVRSLDALINDVVPEPIRRHDHMQLPPALSEQDLLNELRAMADKNKALTSYIGMGYHDNHTPGVILRNILENPGWYTQYTPYQAEIAQGRLEALLNFQTMVTDLTGLPIANASLLDEATAAAEAMAMLFAQRGKNGTKFFVGERVLPQTRAVLETRAAPLGIQLIPGRPEAFDYTEEFFGGITQYPNVYGTILDYTRFCDNAHAVGARVVVAADLLSLVLLTPPGEFGADVVVGTTQRFGVPMGFGGPHAAFFATHDEFKRNLPGRIIGVSVDAQGKPAFRMALQTREQHIRREKATSNICTSQVLLAIMAGMYAVYHGPEGLKRIATNTHLAARAIRDGLQAMGVNVREGKFFDTVCIDDLDELQRKTLKDTTERHGINLGYFGGSVLISTNETTGQTEVDHLLSAISEGLGKPMTKRPHYTEHADLGKFARTSDILTHEVFNSFHSETEMLRYIKRLESKDLSLAQSMIPLGSCTMKLNATTEMIPVTWRNWGGLHPFAPMDQARGYTQLFEELSDQLTAITGFPGISLQPNSGAQGEYAGLMVIREYLLQTGQGHRNVALIPSSAHGTNPASAVMAGMKVVVTPCDANGNVDVAALRAKAVEHKDDLACLMITYPSTHGVFEVEIQEICQLIHDNGGQVYMDGANMNAQVGLTSPALIGADVCHLNLHKTFCIPHGGGGPGMGPIGVAQHLKPYLPGHPMMDKDSGTGMTPVSAAEFGSASILLISYSYIRLMGPDGLTRATMYAILNANYIKARLQGAYDILYSGHRGHAAHEMIIDMRPFKAAGGIEVEDIAKRLMDYSFHAPTVSFPVAGTLMIEPTESESKAELDKFCDAMLAIKREMEDVITGDADRTDNVLKNAPHTAEQLMADEWAHPYTRAQAAYPLPYLRSYKFFPSVARINNTHGDRNLICTCPPMEEYA